MYGLVQAFLKRMPSHFAYHTTNFLRQIALQRFLIVQMLLGALDVTVEFDIVSDFGVSLCELRFETDMSVSQLTERQVDVVN